MTTKVLSLSTLLYIYKGQCGSWDACRARRDQDCRMGLPTTPIEESSSM